MKTLIKLKNYLFPKKSPQYTGWLVVNIKSTQLSFIDHGCYESRHQSWIKMIQDATRNQTFSDQSLALWSGDRPTLNYPFQDTNHYCTSHTMENLQTHSFPDWVYGGWPEVNILDYQSTCEDIRQNSIKKLIPKVMWRGSATHPSRVNLLNKIALSINKDRFDVKEIHWKKYENQTSLTSDTAIPLKNHCNFQALIDIEGAGYSGRVKFLLHTGRPVLLQERDYWDWPMHLLRPWVHYIPLQNNLEDLEEKVKWTFQNIESSHNIGLAGKQFAAQHLTYQNAIERIRTLLQRDHHSI